MLKRFGIAVAALLIGGLVFAQESADLKAAPKAAGSVDSTWEWKGTPRKSPIGEDMTTVTKAKEIPTGTGSIKGAKFEIIKGEAKFKTENGITAIYHNNSSSANYENLEKKRKAEYALTLDDAATVEFIVTGNGSAEASRMVVVKNGEETLLAINNLDQDEPAKTITLANAPAGTYRILVQGSRIVGIKAKN
ncbi:hypothetical protein [Treponema sp.]|uniref:hypothetical protein n=1 Tax=Treponema sp. TaxID=166 RepID=UPI0038907B5A